MPSPKPQIDLAQALSHTHWSKTLNAIQLERVLRDTRVWTLKPGQYAGRKGDTADGWLGVLDGLVKIHNETAEGKSVTLTGVPTGGWVGEGALLKKERRLYDVVALRPTVMGKMPAATFNWLLDTNLDFNRFLLTQLNERLGQFIGMLETDRLLGTEGRIARSLAQLFNQHLYPGVGLSLAISQEEIGFLSGISRQRVNQALRVLEADGVLKCEYGGVRITDLARLRTYP
jgi:CRP/FNR family transcriptional regulator, cyclic AMP receptor protein